MRKMKVMYDDLIQAKATREAMMGASRVSRAAAQDANRALEITSKAIEAAIEKRRREEEERKRREEEERKRREEEERKRREEEERKRREEEEARKRMEAMEAEKRMEAMEAKKRMLQKQEDARRREEEEARRRRAEQEEAKRRKEEEERKRQRQQQEEKSAPGVMVRQKSKREKLLDKLAKNRQKSGRGLRQTSGRGLRQTSGRGLRQTSGRGLRSQNDNQAEQQQGVPKRERKMTGKEALIMAFRSGSVSSRDTEPQGSMTPPPGIKRRPTGLRHAARRKRRCELVLRLFNKVEEEYLDKKAEREDVFDAKGEIRFECSKTDKLGIRRRRSVILNKKRGVIRTLRPGGKEAKQLAVQRIVSVRKDTETQCRIVFGSLDEKRKKSKRAHRPYELLFDSPNELKRFLHSLQVVRESAPKRGMSVMKMERLGSFMNLENSMFGMWCSSA